MQQQYLLENSLPTRLQGKSRVSMFSYVSCVTTITQRKSLKNVTCCCFFVAFFSFLFSKQLRGVATMALNAFTV